MALQDTFVSGILACQNPKFTFPSITAPGLPNFCLACFEANLAGINYIMNFIPPSIPMLPQIKLPTIDIFVKPFLAALKLPASYPTIPIPSIPGLPPINIPGVGAGPFPFDVSAEMKLIAACILLPFQIIESMIKDLLQLQVVVPTIAFVTNLFNKLVAQLGLISVGIGTVAISIVSNIVSFGLCLAKAIVSLFTSFL